MKISLVETRSNYKTRFPVSPGGGWIVEHWLLAIESFPVPAGKAESNY